MADSKHRLPRVAAALAGCAILATPVLAVNINFTTMGTFTTPEYDQSDLHITAQSSPGVAGNLYVLNLNGLGVAGGASDTVLDGTERLFFTATSGDSLTSFTLHQTTIINNNGNGVLGEGVIEAFLGTTSLGTHTIGGSFDVNVSALFPGLTITSFAVSPVDDLRFSSIDFTTSPLTIHWTNAQSGMWDVPANWNPAVAPGTLSQAMIEPLGGLIVSGPAGDTTVDSLTVGAQSSGVAVLDLSSAADLQVSGIATVQSRGALQLGSSNVFRASQLDNSGQVRGSGQVDAALNNLSGGSVSVAAGQSIAFTGAGTNQNAAWINVVGGQLNFTTTLANAATGNITARDAILAFNGGLTNAGQMTFTGGLNDVYGDVQLTGGAAGGRIITSGQAGTTVFFYGNVQHNGAGIDTADGNLTVFFGNVSGAGAFSGSGTVRFEGTYAPGNSPALVAFAGGVSLEPSASLTIDLTGPTRGTQYDALDIAGRLTLHGNLNLTRPASYDPAYLFSHVIIHAGQRDGSFDSISGIALSPTKWLAVTYTSDSVLVTAALPGDANLDGVVNFADFAVLSNHLGNTGGGWADGDFNGDGVTSPADFDALSTSFGGTIGSSDMPAVSDATPVPEPASLLLLGAGLAVLASRRLLRRAGAPDSGVHSSANSLFHRALNSASPANSAALSASRIRPYITCTARATGHWACRRSTNSIAIPASAIPSSRTRRYHPPQLFS